MGQILIFTYYVIMIPSTGIILLNFRKIPWIINKTCNIAYEIIYKMCNDSKQRKQICYFLQLSIETNSYVNTLHYALFIRQIHVEEIVCFF